MKVWLKWLLLSLLLLCGSACMRDETQNRVKSWGWPDLRYNCQLYAFGDRPPCAVVISRPDPGDAGLQIVSGVDWVQVNGIKVVDDGKLTLHWMKGKVHQQTILESGPLYDAVRTYRKQPDRALFDAFFAEHAK